MAEILILRELRSLLSWACLLGLFFLCKSNGFFLSRSFSDSTVVLLSWSTREGWYFNFGCYSIVCARRNLFAFAGIGSIVALRLSLPWLFFFPWIAAFFFVDKFMAVFFFVRGAGLANEVLSLLPPCDEFSSSDESLLLGCETVCDCSSFS